jgi:arsenate reductase-like glutaredoxin family protein
VTIILFSGELISRQNLLAVNQPEGEKIQNLLEQVNEEVKEMWEKEKAESKKPSKKAEDDDDDDGDVLLLNADVTLLLLLLFCK